MTFSKPRAFALPGVMLASAVGLFAGVSAQSLIPAEPQGGRVSVQRVSTNSRAELIASARNAMRTAENAIARGQYAVADNCYRQAWLCEEVREEAAEALRQLHRLPGFKLAADERAVERTRSQLGAGFYRYETSHFVILSDCDTNWTRARGSLLERARHQFYKVSERMGVPALPHEHKLLCVLFNEQDAYSRFAASYDGLTSSWVAGYYATGSNRIVFYNDASSRMLSEALDRLDVLEQAERGDTNRAMQVEDVDGDDRVHASDSRSRQLEEQRNRLREKAAAFSTAKTIHEAVHLLAFNTGLQRSDRDYPFWLSEGLASSFETENADGAFGPEHGSHRREARFESLVRRGRTMPLEEFLGLSEVPGNQADKAAVMYTQGHALFAYLYRHHRKELGAYILAFADEPPGRISPQRQVELFTAHFGDLRSIERRLHLSVR